MHLPRFLSSIKKTAVVAFSLIFFYSLSLPQATAAPTVTVDKSSYGVGESVVFSLSGFPSETSYQIYKISGHTLVYDDGFMSAGGGVASVGNITTSAGSTAYQVEYQSGTSSVIKGPQVTVSVGGGGGTTGGKPSISRVEGCNSKGSDCKSGEITAGSESINFGYGVIHIVGTNLSTTTNTIKIGSKTFTDNATDSGTDIWSNDPGLTVGTYSVTVTNSGGTSNSLTLKVMASSGGGGTTTGTGTKPTVTVSPAGKVKGGSNITINVSNGPANGKACVYASGESCNWQDSDYVVNLDASGSGALNTLAAPDTKEPIPFTLIVDVQTAQGTKYKGAGSVTIGVTAGSSGSGGSGSGGGGDSTGITECDALGGNPPTIKSGSRGSSVTCLQKLLTQQGISGVNADGVFGPATDKAVKEFQEREGLTADGVVSSKTWAALGVAGGSSGGGGESDSGNTDDPATGDSGSSGGGSGLDCKSQGLTEKNGLCLPDNPSGSGKGLVSCSSVGDCLNKIIKFLLTIAAIISVLFIIVGGLQYMTSAGNETKAGAGKKTLTYAIIGLAAIILAYTIVTIIYNTLTKDSIL